MIKLNLKKFFFLLMVIVMVGCGNQIEIAKNQVFQNSDVVHIQNSPPQDQNGGTCMYFATASYIEALRIKEVGTKNLITINPYYLSFIEKLYYFNKLLDTKNPATGFNSQYVVFESVVNGKNFSDYLWLNSDGTSGNYLIENILTIGVVPADVFPLGDYDAYDEGAIIKRIKAQLQVYFDTAEGIAALQQNRKLLTNALRNAYSANFPMPNEFFKFGEKFYTPKMFLESYIKDRSLLILKKYSSNTLVREKFEKIIKMSFYDRIPLITGVHDRSKKVGHAMLMVDYKTSSFPLGQLSDQDMMESRYEPIQGILLKNSWGLSTELTGKKFDWSTTEQIDDEENKLAKRYSLIADEAYERLYRDDNFMFIWAPKALADNVEIIYNLQSEKPLLIDLLQ